MTTNPVIDPTIQKRINDWLNGNYDAETKDTIKKLMQNNPGELVSAFYTNLSFGTGGLRGIMGVGCNRMNTYTVRGATQGLANYIKRSISDLKSASVVISYDSRIRSQQFAQEAARILAANGIKAYIFKELRPTPLVSFACRYKKCTAAIMVTASHNPPAYNGYKVYWSDGAQVLPPHDQEIVKEVNNISDLSSIATVELSHPLIESIDKELDQEYFNAIRGLQHCAEDNKKLGSTLKVVYSALHGTGMTLMPQALKEWGFTNFISVEEQNTPDGQFPTVKYPNPEDPAALKLGIEKMLTTGADLFIANDPDADRLGVAVNHRGKVELLNGNQIACVCLEHICQTLTQQGKMPANAAFVKTIVTSELFAAIAKSYNKPCFDVLTGFKYIGQLIHQWEQMIPQPYQYIFGGEESYGYLLGTHARDKDAIISGCLLCEVALQAKKEGKTLVDCLHAIYKKYGIYREHLLNIDFPETKEGKEKMASLMQQLRLTPPQQIGGVAVKVLEDYEKGTRTQLVEGITEKLPFPKTNVLLFWLSDGSKLAIRPSGTEPKVKVYCGAFQPMQKDKDIQNGIAETDHYANTLLAAVKKLLQA
ncbi:MAG: pgm [Chlamydiales bacterium]|jgi:phosphoglucomutase/phosphomannomutase|nr:pgm [Chlamydiales bacterium]